MSAVRNKVQLIGHLGAIPEIIELESGKKMARLLVGTGESYKNAKGENATDTQWHNVTVFGKLAEIAEKYLNKGIEVAIEGKLIYQSDTDKLGVKRTTAEVQANELLILTKQN